MFTEMISNGGSDVDISNIIDISVQSVARSDSFLAIYTVGINHLSITNPNSSYSVKFYSKASDSYQFDYVAYGSAKTVDVTNYNVVYVSTASATQIKFTMKVVD